MLFVFSQVWSFYLFFLNILQWFLLYIDMNQPWIYMCSPSRFPLPPPSPPHPSGSSQCTSPEHLSHASNLGWRSVSPLIVYLFQCCSLRTSHPCPLPQSLKVCSVYLCLFFLFCIYGCQKYGTLHEFACHPCPGVILIFSVSFQFQYMCCRSEHSFYLRKERKWKKYKCKIHICFYF